MHPVGAQSNTLLNWSHYRELLRFNDYGKINYYINQIITNHWSKRTLQDHIKSKDYQRLSDETKNKLANKEILGAYDNIKNPIYINTYNN